MSNSGIPSMPLIGDESHTLVAEDSPAPSWLSPNIPEDIQALLRKGLNRDGAWTAEEVLKLKAFRQALTDDATASHRVLNPHIDGDFDAHMKDPAHEVSEAQTGKVRGTYVPKGTKNTPTTEEETPNAGHKKLYDRPTYSLADEPMFVDSGKKKFSGAVPVGFSSKRNYNRYWSRELLAQKITNVLAKAVTRICITEPERIERVIEKVRTKLVDYQNLADLLPNI
jgi:hypothetical protein